MGKSSGCNLGATACHKSLLQSGACSRAAQLEAAKLDVVTAWTQMAFPSSFWVSVVACVARTRRLPQRLHQSADHVLTPQLISLSQQ